MPYWRYDMTAKTPKPLVVAHRGDLEHFPENTLSAFESAIDLGADAIELDVFLTKDGELVVVHDHILERTTNGTGYVGDLTLSELRRLDAGSWFGERFRGERIPTLGEVLELGNGRVRFELELRTPARAFLARLLAELARYGVEEEVELTSPTCRCSGPFGPSTHGAVPGCSSRPSRTGCHSRWVSSTSVTT